MGKIFHITSESDWTAALNAGFYTAPSLQKAGFIHCSLPEQIPAVANYNFKGDAGLVLLEIEEAKLRPEVKYEDLWNEGQLYPHIYGPLNVDAVLRTISFPPNEDGTFDLPSEVDNHKRR
ncbi:MAG: DUF952 domain-containing protein [Oligoflexales bacterium]